MDHNSAPGSSGGGILNHGTATLNASQVDDNTAPTDASGGLGSAASPTSTSVLSSMLEGVTNPPPSGVLTLNATVVTKNTASGFGGGIADVGIDANFMPTLPAGSLALNLSAVTANSAGSWPRGHIQHPPEPGLPEVDGGGQEHAGQLRPAWGHRRLRRLAVRCSKAAPSVGRLQDSCKLEELSKPTPISFARSAPTRSSTTPGRTSRRAQPPPSAWPVPVKQADAPGALASGATTHAFAAAGRKYKYCHGQMA